MATSTWTPFANGYSLATLRSDINTFNLAAVTDITAVEGDVTTLQSSKVSKTDTGIVFVSGGVLASASLTTTYQKVGMVDTTSVNVANGHISVDNVNFTYTVNTTGIYKIVFSGAMTTDCGGR